MSIRSKKERLSIELLETQRMLDLVKNHPVMYASLKSKEKELLAELDKIPVDAKEAKAILLFHGSPVYGSEGIDAAFIGKLLVPFQNMVTSEYARIVNGKVGQRGQILHSKESKLFITGLPRGSFGIELSKLEPDVDLFQEENLSDSIVHVARLIDTSSSSDEEFASELDNVSPRTITSLKQFLEAAQSESAGFTIESGSLKYELSPNNVKEAFERVSHTQTSDNIIKIKGFLRGILLESWRFDFVDDIGKKYSGKIDENISGEEAENYDKAYFNKACRASIREDIITFKSGRQRISYTLINIE